MRRTLTPFCFVTVFTVILRVTVSLVRAEETDANHLVIGKAIAIDLLIARPLELVATMLGTGLWIVGLPFTLSHDSTEPAAQKLLVKPVEYPLMRLSGKG